jgi:prepilin-type N-terminal cleavage/methylation domain-containing protein
MSMSTRSSEDGFTITELSLAMSLLGVLMFILLISAMGFVNIYNKGITLKRVNQSGANIGKELQVNLGRSDEVVRSYVGGPADPTSPVNGLCTGEYSFVWSIFSSGTGDVNQAVTHPLVYETNGADQPLYFAKVKDPSKDMCKDAPPKPYKGTDPAKSYQSVELLGDSLVVRDPTPADGDGGGLDVLLNPDNQLTTVIFTISTNGGDDIISDGTNRATCQGDNKDAFCALNTFVVTSYSKGVYN